jgi:hypothetical protein
VADKEPARRPGGRSARVRAAVHQAVTDLVTERGYGNFTMGDIADQAGVADSSLYRRWGNLVLALAGAGEAGAVARDRFIAERRRQLQEMLDRARAREEPVLDALDILDHVLAPLYIRTLFGIGPVTVEQAHQLAEGVLAATAGAD